MATKKRIAASTLTSPTGSESPKPTPPMAAKEQALAELVDAFTAMVSGCFGLHRDGRLAPDQQNQWWLLGVAGTRVVVRFDGSWTHIVGKHSPSVADLKSFESVADVAKDAIRVAKGTPSDSGLATASGATATAIDAVEAMLDSLG